MHRIIIAFGGLTLSLAGAASAAILYPANNGFEVNNLGSGGTAYEYGTVPSWNSNYPPGAGAGEAANGSGFSVTGADNGNSDGSTSIAGQALFLQGGDGSLATTGSFVTQTVNGFVDGTAVINFKAEQRNCCSGSTETIHVYLDGTQIDTFTPGGGSFTSHSTPVIAVTGTSHVIGFSGNTNNQDETVFLDSISITNNVPEPTAMLGALVAFPLLTRRRRA